MGRSMARGHGLLGARRRATSLAAVEQAEVVAWGPRVIVGSPPRSEITPRWPRLSSARRGTPRIRDRRGMSRAVPRRSGGVGRKLWAVCEEHAEVGDHLLLGGDGIKGG